MLFLKWWQPSTWLSGVSDGVIGAVIKGLRSIFYTIISMLYKVIIDLYWLFNTLCTGRLLDNTIMEELSKRVGLILGVIMLFYVVFAFIKMLVDPDIINDKTKGAGNIIKKCIVVIVMLGLSSFVFDTLYMIQRVVVQNNIISKILLPYDVDTDNFGGVLSAELLGAFYKVSDSISDEEKESNSEIQVCQQIVYTLQDKIVNESDFELGNTCLNESVKVDQDDGEVHEITMIDFNWLIGIVAGIAVIYFLVIYCIQVGVRMVQLAVLEIISPMAIVSYLAPKQDTMFSKWTKIYVSTYIDVFIRIAIINFVVFLIATIFDTNGNWAFWQSLNNPKNQDIIVVVMILALLAFAKKAPDLIKDLFPTGSSKLGFGSMHMKDFVGLQRGINTAATLGTGAAIGFLGGAISSGTATYKKSGKKLNALAGGAWGAFTGGLSGAYHGIDNGFKAKSFGSGISSIYREQQHRNFHRQDSILAGSTFSGRMKATAMRGLGMPTAGDIDKKNLEAYNSYAARLGKLEEFAEKDKNVKNLKNAIDAMEKSGADLAQVNRLKQDMKLAKRRVVSKVVSGETTDLDSNLVANMQAYISGMNREFDENAKAFRAAGIERIDSNTTYDMLDTYSKNASTAAIQLENSDQYYTHQADDKFAHLPPREGGHGPGPKK